MMTDFDIRFTPRERNMDQRPLGARGLINALGDFAGGGLKSLTKEDAADAHNYICALEAKVCGLYHELEAMKQQRTERLDHTMLNHRLSPLSIQSPSGEPNDV